MAVNASARRGRQGASRVLDLWIGPGIGVFRSSDEGTWIRPVVWGMDAELNFGVDVRLGENVMVGPVFTMIIVPDVVEDACYESCSGPGVAYSAWPMAEIPVPLLRLRLLLP